ncbi:MAG: YCF48-related protein [bacterium]|nr:YCF48-related protein [bacterium]
MKKALVLVLPIIFTAQACNFLFGELSGDEGSGVRGVFKSLDSGQTWAAIGKVGEKNLANAQVLNIFIEPANANNLIASTFNAGVYASENSGENWVSLVPGFGAYVSIINPTNSQEIFVAGNRNRLPAILKSSDRGGSFVEVFSQPAAEGSVTSLIMDPKNSAILYASLTSGTLIKSLDGGVTWNVLTDFEDRVVRMRFSNDGRIIYALAKGEGLKKSEDAGRTWTMVILENKANTYNDLVVDPQSSANLYMATDKGLFASADGGNTWTKLLLPATPEVNVISTVAVNPKNNRQIFAVIRSTIYRSDDRGQTWRTEPLLTNRVIAHIAIDPNEPNKIYIGLK